MKLRWSVDINIVRFSPQKLKYSCGKHYYNLERTSYVYDNFERDFCNFEHHSGNLLF